MPAAASQISREIRAYGTGQRWGQLQHAAEQISASDLESESEFAESMLEAANSYRHARLVE